jgi:hypothetical protein
MLALALASLLPLAEPAPAIQKVDFESTMDDVGDGIGGAWKSTKRGVGGLFGMGEQTIESYICSDRNFVASRQEEEAKGDLGWRLRGTLKTQGNGFQSRFNFLGAQGNEAHMTLQVGQPMRMTPAQGWVGQVQVNQKFNIPEQVNLLRIRVEGLTQQPYEILCSLHPQNRLK